MLSRGGVGVGAWTEIHLEIGNARSWSHLWCCGNVPKYCGQNWLVVGRLLPKQQQQHYLHRRTNKWAAGWEEPVSAPGHSRCNWLKALVTLHSDQSCRGTPVQPGSTAGTGPRGVEEEKKVLCYMVSQQCQRMSWVLPQPGFTARHLKWWRVEPECSVHSYGKKEGLSCFLFNSCSITWGIADPFNAADVFFQSCVKQSYWR